MQITQACILWLKPKLVVLRGDGAGEHNERRTTFVEKGTYRRRRLMDLARIALIFGTGLIAVPLMWGRPDALADLSGGPVVKTSQALIYLLSVWGGLIVFSLTFSLAVRRWAIHWVQTGEDALHGPVGQSAAGRSSSDVISPSAQQDDA